MTITIKINNCSLQDLREYLIKIADIRAELKKEYPDIVVNAEVGIN
ncbi:MAG: hypothetical protein HPY66_1724 [Firmicutes bacterium]|nr:hypothetical protein [Bacillota bacterium]